MKNKETESKEIKEEVRDIILKDEDVKSFLGLMNIILVDDDRLKPLQIHFIEIIGRNNEIINKQ